MSFIAGNFNDAVQLSKPSFPEVDPTLVCLYKGYCSMPTPLMEVSYSFHCVLSLINVVTINVVTYRMGFLPSVTLRLLVE
jgi:hypothetical protein